MCKYINTSSCIHARYGKSRKYCRHHSKCVKLFIFSSRKYPQKKNVINDRYEQNEEGTVSGSRAWEHESKKEAKSKSQEIVWLSKRIQAFTKRWQLWGNIANQKWWWRWEREWIQIDDDEEKKQHSLCGLILYALRIKIVKVQSCHLSSFDVHGTLVVLNETRVLGGRCRK